MLYSHWLRNLCHRKWSSLVTRGMAEKTSCKTYEQTVEMLNTLQSNAQLIAESKKDLSKESGEEKLLKNEQFLNRVGIKVQDIDQLNPIHMAGTKGKGSVCAMCESIIRASGYKTGFVSSPHLLEVRERIRLNGQPLSKEMFVKYFWDVYYKFCETEREGQRKLPPYFVFLSVMSFKVFLEEKVDVAIVEVGIGGSYDPTNIIRCPKVCGITSLGYDHTDMLGKTITEIGWHKAGIFKPGVPAFTAPQPLEGLDIIRERAIELKVSSIKISPDYSSYPNSVADIGISGGHQLENASLAAQICKTWLNTMSRKNNTPMTPLLYENKETIQRDEISVASNECGYGSEGHFENRNCSENNNSKEKMECGITVAEPFVLPPSFLKGLQECCWPGRCQVIQKEGVTYFFDGAHTNKSLKLCTEWFKKASIEDITNHKGLTVIRVLLFNFSGKRNAQFLMQPLLHLNFDHSLFCPNIIESSNTKSSDQTNFKVSTENILARCHDNALLWKQLHNDSSDASKLANESLVFNSITDAINWVGMATSSNCHLQVLVCGSLYLVGGALASLGYNTDTLLQEITR